MLAFDPHRNVGIMKHTRHVWSGGLAFADMTR